MKTLYTLILLLFSIIMYSQSDSTTTVNNDVLIKAAKTIEQQKLDIQTKDAVISEYKNQITLYKSIMVQDSLHIDYLNKQNEIRYNILLGIQKDLNYVYKDKWYDSKIVWLLAGALVIYSGSLVVSTIR